MLFPSGARTFGSRCSPRTTSNASLHQDWLLTPPFSITNRMIQNFPRRLSRTCLEDPRACSCGSDSSPNRYLKVFPATRSHLICRFGLRISQQISKNSSGTYWAVWTPGTWSGPRNDFRPTGLGPECFGCWISLIRPLAWKVRN